MDDDESAPSSSSVPCIDGRVGQYSRPNLAMIRVKKDIQELTMQRMTAPFASTSIEFPLGGKNLMQLKVNVRLSQGVYRGANFWFELNIPPTYPFHPPSVICLTRVWHPSIDPRNGSVTLPIFGSEWRPVLSINAVVFGLQLLFVEPVTANALNTVAAETLTANPAVFEDQVRQTLAGGIFYGLPFESNLSFDEALPSGTPILKRKNASVDVICAMTRNTMRLQSPPLDDEEETDEVNDNGSGCGVYQKRPHLPLDSDSERPSSLKRSCAYPHGMRSFRTDYSADQNSIGSSSSSLSECLSLFHPPAPSDEAVGVHASSVNGDSRGGGGGSGGGDGGVSWGAETPPSVASSYLFSHSGLATSSASSSSCSGGRMALPSPDKECFIGFGAALASFSNGEGSAKRHSNDNGMGAGGIDSSASFGGSRGFFSAERDSAFPQFPTHGISSTWAEQRQQQGTFQDQSNPFIRPPQAVQTGNSSAFSGPGFGAAVAAPFT